MAGKKNDYEVGYGKPPAHTRFRKGQSGNPSGKPKRVLSEDEILLRELASKVPVTEGGKQRRMSKLEVMLKQQVNLAMKGDPKAVRHVIDAYRKATQNQARINADQGEQPMIVTLVFPEEDLRRQQMLEKQGRDWRDEGSDDF
ncbi:MAG: DUF5681 domain-containing protein [Sphingomonadales bacterium]|jgi:hypothetical protein